MYTPRSSIRADFGGTSGGVLSDLFLVSVHCWIGCCDVELDGMMRGVRTLGDKGCFGELDRDFIVGVSALGFGLGSSDVISAGSSIIGPEIKETMASPNAFCLQLVPGALIERSWIGGRPGIVATP